MLLYLTTCQMIRVVTIKNYAVQLCTLKNAIHTPVRGTIRMWVSSVHAPNDHSAPIAPFFILPKAIGIAHPQYSICTLVGIYWGRYTIFMTALPLNVGKISGC